MKPLLRRFNAMPQENRFLAVVLLILGIVILGFYLTIARSFAVLDESLVQENMHTRMQLFIESYHERGDSMRMPAGSGFIGLIDQHPNSAAVPPEIRLIPTDRLIRNVVVGDDRFHVLHQTSRQRHFYLMLDAKPLDNIKQFILLTALEFVSIAVFAGLAVARWLGHLISRPLTLMANAVREYNPTDHTPTKLGQKFRDHDMADIANAFDSFAERMTEFVSREQAFTEDASHELRTPLTVILSSLQLLADDKNISFSGQLRLARIQRAAENMQSLIEALLWLSREDAVVSMPQMELGDVIQDQVQQLAEQVARKPVKLEFRNLANYPRQVAKGMAASVTGNLLINAVNHTDQGSITITLYDNRFEVYDTGHGIPPEDITHIFERRYRGSLSRGQGLGLYIVKRICSPLGWEVSVHSPPGQGTRFVVGFYPEPSSTTAP